MTGIEFLIVFAFTICFIFLSANYPKELELEVKRFCAELDNPEIEFKKDYFWIFRAPVKKVFPEIILASCVFLILSFFISLNSTTQLQFIVMELLLLFLSVIAYVDAKTQLIPDALPLLIAITGLLFAPELFSITLEQSVFGMVLGYLSLYSVLWITSFILKKEAMGGGDVKLVSAIGAVIGAENLPLLLLLSSLLALIMLFFNKKTRNQQFAFGPYISIASFFIILMIAGFIPSLDFHIH